MSKLVIGATNLTNKITSVTSKGGILNKVDDLAGKGTNANLSKLTPEMENKILSGQRIDGSNKIIGGTFS